MILQTNSYIVPKEKRAEHARLVARFRQCLARLGCDHFECYEQVGANWNNTESSGRFVQIMHFADRKQQQKVQGAERSDPAAQTLIKEFCDLINFPYQQQQGLFVVGFYNSALTVPPPRALEPDMPADATDADGDTNGESLEAAEEVTSDNEVSDDGSEPLRQRTIDPSIHHS